MGKLEKCLCQAEIRDLEDIRQRFQIDFSSAVVVNYPSSRYQMFLSSRWIFLQVFFFFFDKPSIFLLAEIWEYQVQGMLVFGFVFCTCGCRC